MRQWHSSLEYQTWHFKPATIPTNESTFRSLQTVRRLALKFSENEVIALKGYLLLHLKSLYPPIQHQSRSPDCSTQLGIHIQNSLRCLNSTGNHVQATCELISYGIHRSKGPRVHLTRTAYILHLTSTSYKTTSTHYLLVITLTRSQALQEPQDFIHKVCNYIPRNESMHL